LDLALISDSLSGTFVS